MFKEYDFLYKIIQGQVGSIHIAQIPIPQSISQNLNPKFGLRPYQTNIFQHFIAYLNPDYKLRQEPSHLLFQMATGSGKTLMMAGFILYLYEKGYRNFLFFVNSSTIIEKTKDNFTNTASPKYLFAPEINIGGQRVSITTANDFDNTNDNDICIVFDTIQGLHSKLTVVRENAVSLNTLEGKKIVMIADEAHHLSADTKSGVLIKTDTEAKVSWEGAVKKILDTNTDNLLLDFTATAELQNKLVLDKYKDKMLSNYALSAFRKDGYSKEVEIFKSDSAVMERALQAVILSHYRKKLFAEMGFDIKPVILFKSKNVEPSNEFMQEFITRIKTLQPSDIEHIKIANPDGILHKVFTYFDQQKLNITDLITELRIDFDADCCVSANDDKEKAKLQIQLNTLEDPDNAIRAVFAVDKLNEGWDVLNLFDIVRLYETRDSGKGKIGKSTAAEAQLIGRGARYCPFPYGDIPKDMRKFDKDLNNPYRACETMYYHSNNDSKYINEITQALVDSGIMDDKMVRVDLNLKQTFKDSHIYENGLLFLNEQIEIKPTTLPFGAEMEKHLQDAILFSGKTTTAKVFKQAGEPDPTNDTEISKQSTQIKMSALGINVLRAALHTVKKFEFCTLKAKFPELTSLDEFITSPTYLADITINVTGGAVEIKDYTQADKLRIAKQVLHKIDIVENSKKKQYTGTTEFKAHRLKTIIQNKSVNYSKDDSRLKKDEHGNPTPNADFAYDKAVTDAEWYAFTDCYGTSEEKALVTFMKAKYEVLKKTYQEIYLIRNERHFAIYDYAEGRRFEPDFLLLLKKEGEPMLHYQLFIEPKGEYLMKEDKWKETFLKELHDKASIEKKSANRNAELDTIIRTFWKDDEFTVWGLPFYNETPKYKQFFNGALDNILP